MGIQRDTVQFNDIDVVILHDNNNNVVSVNVYDNTNKRLAGCELMLIGRHDTVK